MQAKKWFFVFAGSFVNLQRKEQIMKKILILMVMFSFAAAAFADNEPDIVFTKIPGEKGGELEGMIKNFDHVNNSLVIYTYGHYRDYGIGVDVWKLQKYNGSKFTKINSFGSFKTNVRYGKMYSALLVKNNYKPKKFVGCSAFDETFGKCLPDKVGGKVIKVKAAWAK